MFDNVIKKFGTRGKGYRWRDNKLIKGMKAFHLLAAIAWGGGAFAMQALALLRQSQTEPTAEAIVAYCSWWVDTWVVMPGLLGCLFSGLFYSIFTAIGFFKFAWIGYKWLITASACFWGLLFWSGSGDKLIAWLAAYDLEQPLLLVRSCILPDNIWGILLQTAIIFSMCLISVYRPVSFKPSWFFSDKKYLAQRSSALMPGDLGNISPLDNSQVAMLYANWLGEPQGPQAQKLFHARFADKSALLNKLRRADLYPPRHEVQTRG